MKLKKIFFTSTQARLNPQQDEFYRTENLTFSLTTDGKTATVTIGKTRDFRLKTDFSPKFYFFHLHQVLSHILHNINTNLAIIIIKPGQCLFPLSPFSSLLLQFLVVTYKSFCDTWPEYFVTIKFL